MHFHTNFSKDFAFSKYIQFYQITAYAFFNDSLNESDAYTHIFFT